MLNSARLILASLVVSSTLVACGDNEATSTEPTSAPTAAATAAAATGSAKIEAGMSEKAAADLLGEVSHSETSSIDALTITHTEWTTAEGTTSVQFHNGKAVYSQFVAAAAE